MVQQEIARNVIVNITPEVISRVLSNPSIEVFAKSDSFFSWGNLVSPVVSALLAALLTYVLTNRLYLRRDKKKQEQDEKSMATALKYELFYNFYEMKDVGRVAESAKKMFDDSSKPIYPQDFSKIIYSPPLFTAFEAMISNNLLAAVVNEEKKVFSIYSFLREYDLAYKQLLEEIDRVFMTARDGVDLMPYQKKEVSRKLYSLIHWADTLAKAFEGREGGPGYLDLISFLNREEWEDFKKRNPLGEN